MYYLPYYDSTLRFGRNMSARGLVETLAHNTHARYVASTDEIENEMKDGGGYWSPRKFYFDTSAAQERYARRKSWQSRWQAKAAENREASSFRGEGGGGI